ncbi:hypothetical protein LJK88_26945 [Paenibacillus sp. P26]|nr:hypothetical protein LJK88_26945 [Paenibacillus sp. P26]UUZ94990.1 hypothetical protein LJK87_11060 [Paenibacillus sp. P25]
MPKAAKLGRRSGVGFPVRQLDERSGRLDRNGAQEADDDLAADDARSIPPRGTRLKALFPQIEHFGYSLTAMKVHMRS